MTHALIRSLHIDANEVDYLACIKFDRYLAELAVWLVEDLRAGKFGDEDSLHIDGIEDWAALVCVRSYAMPDWLADGDNNLIGTYIVTHAIGRRWLEPDPDHEDCYRLTRWTRAEPEAAPRRAAAVGSPTMPPLSPSYSGTGSPVDRVAYRLVALLSAAEGRSMARSELRRALAADVRKHFDEAAAALVTAGQVRVDEVEYRGRTGERYSLALDEVAP